MPEFRALLSYDSEMAQRIRAHDWAATPFGSPYQWPQSLRSAVSICLNSSFPTAIYWGPELRLLYNDAWAFIPGPRHPDALGKQAAEVWPDIWHIIEPQLQSVLSTGRGFVTREQMLPMMRHGMREETYWDYSFTPIAGEKGKVAGIFNQGQDITGRVLIERRSRLMLNFSDKLRILDTPGEVLAAGLEMAGSHLGVERLFYGDVPDEGEMARIEGCWSNDVPAPIAGTIPFSAFGADAREALRRGESFAIADVDAEVRSNSSGVRDNLVEMETRALLLAPITRNGRCVAILVAQQNAPRLWTSHDHHMIQSIAARLWHEVSRARSEMALRESERRHRLIFEQARDIIFTADLNQCISACNPAAAAAIGLPAEQIIGRSISEFTPMEEFEKTTAMLQQKLHEGGMTRYEVSVCTASGRIRQWDVNSALTIDLDGRPIGLHAVARDVTEQRAFDEQQQLLINELNHRVKNTLALVQGLALQSFKRDRTVTEGQEVFQARLGMLAAGHDLLTREKWEGATVAALVADATAPYADPPGRILAGGDPVVLTPQAAISLGMALHELGTNAAKYGALSHPEGRVTVNWSLGPDRNFTFLWLETGGPQVSPPTRQGFGLRMIERALANDLNGKVSVDFAPDGIICRITANLPEPS
jgi:PAS domain S-box-containing protein